MRLINKKHLKNKLIALRFTDKQYNHIKMHALLYSEGNISEYMLYAALNYKVRQSDLEKGRTKSTPPNNN